MLPLSLSNVAVSFPGIDGPVLSIPALRIEGGERVAVTGPSGSGKSTFVNIVTGLEKLRHGHANWGDTDLAGLSESRRDRWRGENIGLIMQDFHLFPGLSALENVLLPARLARALDARSHERAHALLNRVGLSRHDQNTATMSRGEMQRVAVARALLRKPGIVIADEPTASLDAAAGEIVSELLLDLAENSTLIVISHDRRLIEPLGREISLSGGMIASDAKRS